MKLHPRFVTLSRFVDDELRPWARSRVARHVVACVRCRGALADIRALPHTGVVPEFGGAPAGLLERVLARRDAGDRVILPATDLHAPRRPVPGFTWAVASSAVALLAVSSTTPTSTLTFMPAKEDGVIAVAFYSRGGLTEDSVFLRARYREVGDGACPGGEGPNVAVLERRDHDTYRGVLHVRSAFHAVFSVVDQTGQTLEKGWGPKEILVHRGAKSGCTAVPPILALSRLPIVPR